MSIDSPGQHAEVVDSLRLPFPILSDPDRTAAIRPYDLVDEKDRRNLSRPAMVLVTPDGEEAWRFVSRDYADRLAEDELIKTLQSLELPPTSPEPVEVGPLEPGQAAMPFEQLFPYFRGARYAVSAMVGRHASMAEDGEVFVAQMDRYMENVKRLFKDKRDSR